MPLFSRTITCILFLLAATLFCSCQQQALPSKAYTPRYVYHKGYTPVLHNNGKVGIPSKLPARVKRVLIAGNKIVGRPYRSGGGHRRHHDSGYDCSGTVAFVLREAGLLKPNAHPTSGDFLRWGRPGFGKHLTIYAKRGHVFLMVNGMRLDTTSEYGRGPRWSTRPRRCSGFYVRHIPGL